MSKIYLAILVTCAAWVAYGQGNVGVGTGTPDASAQLDVLTTAGTDRGVLIPRISIGNVNTFGLSGSTNTESMLVYNINASTTGGQGKGFYYWNGSRWVRFLVGLNTDHAWMITGNSGIATPGTPATYGTSNIAAAEEWFGTTDGQSIVFGVNSKERMRLKYSGALGIGTATPDTTFMVTINPTTNAQRNGISMSFPGSGTISSTAYGIDITATTNQNIRGFRYINTTTGNGALWGTGAELSATSIVSGYTAYRNGSGLSYGLYGINGTNAAYTTSASTWAAFLQGRTVISSESSPTSGLGTDLEIRNTTAGAGNPVTVSLRQTTQNTTSGTVLANINFGDNYQTTPQAQLRVFRHATASSTSDIPTSFSFYTNMDASGSMVERMRISAATNNTSEVWVNQVSPYPGVDVFSATSNLSGDYGVNGYNILASATNGGGVYGETRSAGTFGVWGTNTHSSGTGVVGSGQNQLSGSLIAGSGGAFTGNATGAYIYNTSCGVGQSIYTVNGLNGTCNVTCRVNYWDGFTQYKILGTGSVSTIAKTPSGNKVVLHAPETPEIYFQDYGNGKLVNGKAHIDLDPIMTHNIVVDEEHPLQVFIQLNGDCKGVFVSNRTATGFDVTELQGGTSNVEFTWSITANRADEELAPGKISKNADVRFEPAPQDLEVNTAAPKVPKGDTE